MKSNAQSVQEYLAAQPADRRATLKALRALIRRNLPAGFVECLQCGMISYVIPRTRFPHTYNGHPLAIITLGSQKNHLALYLMCIYGNTTLRSWLEAGFRKAGRKLDAGKACVRFQTLDDLPLEVIGQAVRRVSVEQLIGWHDRAQAQRPHKRLIAKSRAINTANSKT